MAGLTGKSTDGVGADIVSYLSELANFFGITIRVTSGYRSPDQQAQAMFDNWIGVKRGQVYRTSTLPVKDRTKLNTLWNDAHSHSLAAPVRSKAKSDFLSLAKARMGTRSKHSQGRAVDVSREHINDIVYRAITLYLHNVKEEANKKIYHFESTQTIPDVDANLKAKWEAIQKGVHPVSAKAAPHLVWC